MTEVCFPFFGNSLGGSQRSALEIYKNLSKHKKISFIIHSKGIFYDYLKKNNIKFYYLPIINVNIKYVKIQYLLLIIFNFLRILNFLKKNKIKNIHGNTLLINLLWSFPSIFYDTKFIWHQRQFLSSSPFWKLINLLADKIVANSPGVLRTIPKNVDKKKKIFVENFIDSVLKYNKNLCRIWLKNKINLRKPYFLAGYVGRVIKQKKVEDIIEAINILPEQYKKKIFLIICGNFKIDYKKELFKKINLYKLKNIFFLNHSNEVYKIYSALNLAIMPSPNETYGRTPIEAMTQGTLVLASDCYGHRQSVINNINGYLYKKNNIEDLKNKIIFIMNCKRNKKIIKNANIFLKKKIIQQPLLIKKLLDIYK